VSAGTSYSDPTDAPLEENVRSGSTVDDVPELIALLRWILVYDPLRRPDAPALLNHPWFVGSPGPDTPPGSAPDISNPIPSVARLGFGVDRDSILSRSV